MKQFIKPLLPQTLIHFANRLRLKARRLGNTRKTTEQVFTDIYLSNAWGGEPGEYCSGSGSVDARVVGQYIHTLNHLADEEGFRGRRFVDLGCGDFRVGRQLLHLCSNYVGVDIVGPLIAKLAEENDNPKVKFSQLNIIDDALPQGDVCLIRQVLQHLSNKQISMVLAKVSQYKWVFITEHYPSSIDVEKNIDKPHGGDIRLYDNSGVYLCDPPFSIRSDAIKLVLEVPVVENMHGGVCDAGVIRTFLYKPVQAQFSS